VYNEKDGDFFQHHDILLTSFPLCMEWLDYDPGVWCDCAANRIAAITSLVNLNGVCEVPRCPPHVPPTPSFIHAHAQALRIRAISSLSASCRPKSVFCAFSLYSSPFLRFCLYSEIGASLTVQIEVWDVDVIDSVEPVLTLGEKKASKVRGASCAGSLSTRHFKYRKYANT
jgi:hypothetical protein